MPSPLNVPMTETAAPSQHKATLWVAPLPRSLIQRPALMLDLSASNPALAGVAVDDPAALGAWITAQAQVNGCDWALGGYAEDRAIYAMSPLFADGPATRSVHLGVDFWLPAGTEVHAVADAVVHSTGNNAAFGDYGPTIILEHEREDTTAYTLYGHLARQSLSITQPGQRIQAGQQIGWLGEPDENVGWPPHLHFQIIREIGDHAGDFPGVCHQQQQRRWLDRCPSPMTLVQAWCPDRRTSNQPGNG